MAREVKGPKFVQFFDPLLQALKLLGNSARPSAVVDKVAELKKIPDSQRQEVLQSGALRFDNQVAFARQYLVWAGLIDSSIRGVWSITEKGLATKSLGDAEALKLFKTQHALHTNTRKIENKETDDTEEEPSLVVLQENYKTQLLKTIRELSPSGFERLCQRLLLESGFEQVQVTGRSGDNGIDGTGIARVNGFVTFRMLFQCKKYAGSVGSEEVRNFRGAMTGRADKGMILTTGYFTKPAHEEAIRTLPYVELVEGDQLVEQFEQLELGLRPRKTFDVDTKFFEQFRTTRDKNGVLPFES